ncbi:hypothetical protein OSTOST_14963, partial [Ostertagia ostertagi]
SFQSQHTETRIALSNRFEKGEQQVSQVAALRKRLHPLDSDCGIRGRMSVKDEGQVLSTLEVPTNKDAGVTSICLDRFGSSLFAAVTDNCVYEYGILTSNTKP